MKKISKVLSCFTAITTIAVPSTLLVSCSEPEPPEPVDTRKITIDESKKIVSLSGETTFSIIFNANWTITESDLLTVETKIGSQSTAKHKVTLEYDASKSIGTQTIVCNATYSYDGESEIQDYSKVLYSVKFADADTNKTWQIDGFKTNFEYVHGTLVLNDPSQKDSYIYTADQAVAFAFNLNGTEVGTNDTVSIEFVNPDHSTNVEGFKHDTITIQDGVLLIPTRIKPASGKELDDYDYASCEGIKFICRDDNNKIRWTQNLSESLKITFVDILKDAIYMPEFEKQYLANLHETEGNVQTYTIFYSADIVDPLVNLEASIICSENEVAYCQTEIKEGGTIGDYNYVTLEVSFWSNEGCTEKWNQDTSINFDIKIVDLNWGYEFTFEGYTFNYLVKRITENGYAWDTWSCDPNRFETPATFAEGEDAIYAVPEFYNPSSDDISGKIAVQPFIEDGNIKFDVELTTKNEYGLKGGDSVCFRMTFYCYNSKTEKIKWVQTVDGYKIVFREAWILKNPVVHVKKKDGKATFKFDRNSSVYTCNLKEAAIQNFISDTIKYEKFEADAPFHKTYMNITVFFHIDETLKPGDSAKFTIYIQGTMFDGSSIFKKYYHNCELVIDE